MDKQLSRNEMRNIPVIVRRVPHKPHRCPVCDEEIVVAFAYCPYCGQKLDWQEFKDGIWYPQGDPIDLDLVLGGEY